MDTNEFARLFVFLLCCASAVVAQADPPPVGSFAGMGVETWGRVMVDPSTRVVRWQVT